MKKTTIVGTIAAAAMLISSACLIPIYLPDSGGYPPRNEFHQVVALDPGGTISLESSNGDIEIRGWDKNEVEITADDDWSRPYGRRTWSTGWGGASGPKIDVEKIENFVKIRSRVSGREDEIRAVHIYLNVPRSVNLRDVRGKVGDILIADLYGKVRADLEDGNIKIENFSGSLDLSLGSGTVEAEILDLRPDDDIRVTVREGPVTLFLQPEVNARIEASAANGTVTAEFDLGQTLPAKKVSGLIGAKTEATAVSVTALNGNIRLNKAK